MSPPNWLNDSIRNKWWAHFQFPTVEIHIYNPIQSNRRQAFANMNALKPLSSFFFVNTNNQFSNLLNLQISIKKRIGKKTVHSIPFDLILYKAEYLFIFVLFRWIGYEFPWFKRWMENVVFRWKNQNCRYRQKKNRFC